MASTPGPRGIIPAPLHYPGGRGRVGHRLSVKVIAAIIAIVVLLARGRHRGHRLERHGNSPPTAANRPTRRWTHHHRHRSHRNANGRNPTTPRTVVLAARTALAASVLLATATPIDLGGGISVTPAAG